MTQITRGELLLRERAVTVGKSGDQAFVSCDNCDDAMAVWAFLESLGEEQPATRSDIVQATHPADGAEPIDEDWLPTIGYTFNYLTRRWDNLSTDVELWRRDANTWQICVGDSNGNGIHIAEYRTRSQLRDLLAALGVV